MFNLLVSEGEYPSLFGSREQNADIQILYKQIAQVGIPHSIW
jgi:hypothetical protein